MKKNISDTWLRRVLSSGELKPGDEVYDEKELGLVFRVRVRKRSWYLYTDRARTKRLLCEWPEYGTEDARTMCKKTKVEGTPRTRKEMPTLKQYFDEEYKQAFELTNKSTNSLWNLSALLERYGGEPLNGIDDELIQSWRLSRRRSGIKPTTINRQISSLRSLLRSAVPKYLDADPIASLKPLKVDQEHRVRYLSADEEKRLREAMDFREVELRDARVRANEWRERRGYDPLEDLSNYPFADHLKPMVLLSMNTGLRRGELFALKWRDINDGFARVTSAVAKSRRSRNVPLNREATSVIDGWKSRAEDQEFVFPGKDGQKESVRKAWGSLLKKAEVHDFHWHDMRHHFASQLVMKGIPLNTVRELLGHADLATTLRYAHLAPKHLREAVEVLHG